MVSGRASSLPSKKQARRKPDTESDLSVSQLQSQLDEQPPSTPSSARISGADVPLGSVEDGKDASEYEGRQNLQPSSMLDLSPTSQPDASSVTPFHNERIDNEAGISNAYVDPRKAVTACTAPRTLDLDSQTEVSYDSFEVMPDRRVRSRAVSSNHAGSGSDDFAAVTQATATSTAKDEAGYGEYDEERMRSLSSVQQLM